MTSHLPPNWRPAGFFDLPAGVAASCRTWSVVVVLPSPPPPATRHGVLPLEVLLDVLVRLPAKEICRLRAVSRPWRSLTSDPVFIKAHAARHPGPLIVASFGDDPEHVVHLMDLSGHVVKRVPIPSFRALLPSCLDLIAFYESDGSGSCQVINPATGAASHLPTSENSLEEPWSVWGREPVASVFALGRVNYTGEYKMLRLSCLTGYNNPDEDVQVCSVLTVNGASGSDWTFAESPEFIVDMNSGAVVGGVVFYFWAEIYTSNFDKVDLERDGLPECIASFDLGTEDWTTISAPRLDPGNGNGYDQRFHEYIDMWSHSSLAELKGHLVLAHNNHRRSSCLELWFLTDMDNGLWVKEYSIRTTGEPVQGRFLEPLLLLDDGRIVMFLPFKLLLYDPVTNVFSEVETRCLQRVGLYTCSLLSLQSVANV